MSVASLVELGSLVTKSREGKVASEQTDVEKVPQSPNGVSYAYRKYLDLGLDTFIPLQYNRKKPRKTTPVHAIALQRSGVRFPSAPPALQVSYNYQFKWSMPCTMAPPNHPCTMIAAVTTVSPASIPVPRI